jgi:tetratricopeptide (TPR) repeat protein
MKTLHRYGSRLTPLQRIELVALPLLIAVAGFLWTAPTRAERRLRSASFSELRAASLREPNNARVFYHLGIRLRDLGQLGPADAALARAAALDPESEETWLAWGAAAAAFGRDQEAFEAFSKCALAHPNSKQAHLALAVFCHQHFALPRAYEEAVAATRCDPQDATAWRLAGVTALQLQDLQGAENALRRAIALAPADWRSQLALGQLLTARHRSAEALNCYQEAARLAPDQAQITLVLGEAQLRAAKSDSEVEAARGTVARAVQQDPTSAGALILLGQALVRLGRWQEARTTLAAAEKSVPRNASVHFELARVYRQLGDSAAAARETQAHAKIKSYDEARLSLGSQVRTGKDSAIRLRLARLCAANGDVQQAIIEYRTLIAHASHVDAAQRELAVLERNHPEARPGARVTSSAMPRPAATTGGDSSVAALLHDADSVRQRGYFPEAESAYLQIIARDPRSAKAFQGLGLSLIGQGKTEEAFRALDRALKLEPLLPEAQFELAHLYYDQGFVDEAARRMEALTRQMPAKGEYLHALAVCYLDDPTRYLGAEQLLKRAIALEPSKPVYIRELAKTETNLNRPEEAERLYRQALSLDSEGLDSKLALGTYLLDHRPTTTRQQEAERLLSQVVAKDGANANGLLGLGRLALNGGEVRQAVPRLQAAVARDPNLAAAWYHLARAYDRAGDSVRAQDCRTAFRDISSYRQDLSNTEERARTRLKDPALRLKLARLYEKGGQHARAINQYQVCLSLAPNNTAVRQEMQALTARLQSSGQLPSMNTLNGMLLASTKARQ